MSRKTLVVLDVSCFLIIFAIVGQCGILYEPGATASYVPATFYLNLKRNPRKSGLRKTAQMPKLLEIIFHTHFFCACHIECLRREVGTVVYRRNTDKT